MLEQGFGMLTAHVPKVHDRAKAWAEFSIIPQLVVKSSLVSLLLLPQRPEREIESQLQLDQTGLTGFRVETLTCDGAHGVRWRSQVQLDLWRHLDLELQSK